MRSPEQLHPHLEASATGILNQIQSRTGLSLRLEFGPETIPLDMMVPHETARYFLARHAVLIWGRKEVPVVVGLYPTPSSEIITAMRFPANGNAVYSTRRVDALAEAVRQFAGTPRVELDGILDALLHRFSTMGFPTSRASGWNHSADGYEWSITLRQDNAWWPELILYFMEQAREGTPPTFQNAVIKFPNQDVPVHAYKEMSGFLETFQALTNDNSWMKDTPGSAEGHDGLEAEETLGTQTPTDIGSAEEGATVEDDRPAQAQSPAQDTPPQSAKQSVTTKTGGKAPGSWKAKPRPKPDAEKSVKAPSKGSTEVDQ